jgi:hypothetical protein
MLSSPRWVAAGSLAPLSIPPVDPYPPIPRAELGKAVTGTKTAVLTGWITN